MSDTDDRLLTLAVDGSEKALSELLERCGPQIARQLDISPRWNGLIDADDVMQVTYLEAFLRIRQLEATSTKGFSTWLRRIAQNNLRDAIKELERDKRPQSRPRAASADDSYGELLDRLTASGTTPSRNVSRRETRRIIDDAMAKLPRLYGEVIRLCDLEGKTGPQVAQLLGRSHGAVRMLLARARDLLAEVLGSESAFFSRSA